MTTPKHDWALRLELQDGIYEVVPGAGDLKASKAQADEILAGRPEVEAVVLYHPTSGSLRHRREDQRPDVVPPPSRDLGPDLSLRHHEVAPWTTRSTASSPRPPKATR